MDSRNLKITEPARELPVLMDVDVVVVGGGPSGIAAAWAASKSSLSVSLVELRSFLGGNLTIGLPILDFHSQKGIQVITGLAQKFVDRLTLIDAASDIQICPLHMSISFIEPEAVKMSALDIMKENSVEVLLNTICAGTITEGASLKGIIIESKSGREVILAKVIIDCTGDADVAFQAGALFNKGNNKGLMQPATLEFSMVNVDVDKLRLCIAEKPDIYTPDFIPPEYYSQNRNFILVGLRSLMQKAKDDGITLPVNKTVIVTGLMEGEIWVNMTRVNGVDGTNAGIVTKGEHIARGQIRHIEEYFIKYVPGFENAKVGRVAPFIGIRETRRIVGKYILTRDDILSCRKFDDAIAVASYPIDIHHPEGGGFSLEWCGDCYDIPYRSLIPEKIENLLVAGRCISASHEAMASTRVMAPCMAMGEAAGYASIIAVNDNLPPSQIDVVKLKAKLLSEGVYLRSC